MPWERHYAAFPVSVKSFFRIFCGLVVRCRLELQKSLSGLGLLTYGPVVHPLRGCGPALDRLCRERGFTKAELARRMSISPSGVTDLLAPDAWPNTRRIDQALAALDATVHDFARALDQVNRRVEPEMASEVREGPAVDPLDQHLSAVNNQLRALVEEVKRRSPRG